MQWNFSELSTTGRNILTQRLTPEMRVNGESGTPWSSCSGNFTGVKPLLSNCTGVNPRSSIFTGVNPLLSNCIWNRQVQKDVYLKMDIFEPVMVDYIAVWPLPIHFFSIQNFFKFWSFFDLPCFIPVMLLSQRKFVFIIYMYKHERIRQYRHSAYVRSTNLSKALKGPEGLS